jgi:hypothetical protein
MFCDLSNDVQALCRYLGYTILLGVHLMPSLYEERPTEMQFKQDSLTFYSKAF